MIDWSHDVPKYPMVSHDTPIQWLWALDIMGYWWNVGQIVTCQPRGFHAMQSTPKSAGADSSNLNPPRLQSSSSSSSSSSSCFSSSSFATMWWAQVCPRLAQQALDFEHVAVISVVFFRLLWCVCHRFAASFLMSNTWYRQVVCHTHNLSIHGLFPKAWLAHSCFGLNLNHGLHKSHVLCKSHRLHITLVYTKTVLCTKTIFYSTQKYVLPRPVQVLFAPCRTALSIVAGGTRRRRLSNTIYPMHFYDTSKMRYQWDLNFWLHLIKLLCNIRK